MSRWNGYDSRIINGTVGQRKSPHSWVEITFDGKSYIFDTELEMAYIKKGEQINMWGDLIRGSVILLRNRGLVVRNRRYVHILDIVRLRPAAGTQAQKSQGQKNER